MRKVYLLICLSLSITLFGLNVLVPFGPFKSYKYNRGNTFLSRGEVLGFDKDIDILIPEDGKILKFYPKAHSNFGIDVSNFLITSLDSGRILVYNNINYDKTVTGQVKKGAVLGSLISDGEKFIPIQIIYYEIEEGFSGDISELLYNMILELDESGIDSTIFNIFDFYKYSDLFYYSSGE